MPSTSPGISRACLASRPSTHARKRADGLHCIRNPAGIILRTRGRSICILRRQSLIAGPHKPVSADASSTAGPERRAFALLTASVVFHALPPLTDEDIDTVFAPELPGLDRDEIRK